MIAKEVLNKVLWATTEDYIGLYPENDEMKNEEIAKRILGDFIKEQLITCYFGKWGTEELKEIPIYEIKDILQEVIYWRPPSVGERCFKIGSTSKGEEYYKNKQLKDID
jgi:uncharacterized protein (UPF0248 family)